MEDSELSFKLEVGTVFTVPKDASAYFGLAHHREGDHAKTPFVAKLVPASNGGWEFATEKAGEGRRLFLPGTEGETWADSVMPEAGQMLRITWADPNCACAELVDAE